MDTQNELGAWVRAAVFVLACLIEWSPFMASCGWAGAYTLPEGEVKLFVSALKTSGDRYFDHRGRLKSRPRFTKFDLQFFGEYGVTGFMTLFASTTTQSIQIKDDVRSRYFGLGRSEVGARIRVLDSSGWIASVQSSGVVAGTRGRGLAVIGETDHQIDARGLIARNFTALGRPAFIDLQAGYRIRTGDPADELRVDATFGLRPLPSVLVLLQSFNTFGRERWRGPYPLKQRIHKVQIGALYDVSDAISLYAAGFMTPTARDALDEQGVVLGAGYRF